MDETRLKQIEAILKLLDADYVSSGDFTVALSMVLEQIKEVISETDTKLENVHGTIIDVIQNTIKDLNKKISDQSILSTEEKKILTNSITGIKIEFKKNLTDLENKISKNIIEASDTSDIELELAQIQEDLKKPVVLDTALEIKKKLLSLSDKDKLKLKDLGGFEELIKQIEKLGVSRRLLPQSGITTTFFALNGADKGRAKNINFVSGTTLNVVLMGDTATITIPVGGGGTVISVTDDGNGVVAVDNTDPINPVVTFLGISHDITLTGDGSPSNPLSVVGGADQNVVAVDASTTAVLAGSPTYNNGTAGVGATLTRTGSGALPAQDGVTLLAGERLLVKNQVAQLQNGVYEVTQVGSVSTPYILTRATDSDDSTELDGQIVSPARGTTNKGKLFAQQTNLPVMGTDPIVYLVTTGVFVTESSVGAQVLGQIPTWDTVLRRLLRGNQDFTWDTPNKIFHVGDFIATGNGTQLILDDTLNTFKVQTSTTGIGGKVYIGDYDQQLNSTFLFMDDSSLSDTVRLNSQGVIQIGDTLVNQNGTILSIDDFTQDIILQTTGRVILGDEANSGNSTILTVDDSTQHVDVTNGNIHIINNGIPYAGFGIQNTVASWKNAVTVGGLGNINMYVNYDIDLGEPSNASYATWNLRLRADADYVGFLRIPAGQFTANESIMWRLSNVGYMGVGPNVSVGNPTAVVDADASTTAGASLRLRNGVAPTSPNDGDMWTTTTHLFARLNGVTYQLDQQSGSGGTVISVSFTGGLISVANPTTTPAFTVAGTSGGIPYFSSTSTWASSALLVANAIMIGGGAGTAPSTTTTGTGVLTALGINVGSAGAFTTNNAANTFTAKQTFQLATTPVQIGFDASNFLTITPDSVGNTTFALTGTAPVFAFSQGISITGLLSVSAAASFNSTSRVFRTTNGGTNINAVQMFDISGSTTTAGALAIATDSSFGLSFTAANGTRRIARASIQITNLVNTAASESADLSFNTQRSAGAAISNSMTLSSVGNLTLAGGNFTLNTAGNGILIKEGTNATSGVATLVAGTVTVSTTKVTANSRIYISVQSLGTVAVATPIAVTARTAGTSFVITSSSITDTSVISWLIIEPA